MKSTDEVVTDHLGPPVVPSGQRRFFLIVLVVGAAALFGFYLLLGALHVCACSSAVPTPDVRSPVDGVIIAVDSSGLADVRGFTLRPSGSGFSFGFTLGALENPTEFPPGHLGEHLATSQPVRVYFRTEGGKRLVYRLEDAPAS